MRKFSLFFIATVTLMFISTLANAQKNAATNQATELAIKQQKIAMSKMDGSLLQNYNKTTQLTDAGKPVVSKEKQTNTKIPVEITGNITQNLIKNLKSLGCDAIKTISDNSITVNIPLASLQTVALLNNVKQLKQPTSLEQGKKNQLINL